ncbi:MAG: aspartate carbamoyltransferase catalytic subunit [Bacillota bacterium]|nr:aspartate carbamoyltransferase catalytic subunit [Bacillota bacterium]
MRLAHKDILGLEEMTAGEILLILDTADSMKEILTRTIKKVPTLRGRSLCTLFYEASTRTRTSFELAAKYMSADTVSVATTTSSVQKGETLKDTAMNIEAMGVDVVVMRHPVSGSCHFLSRLLKASVINAGDGMHEHPTQGLLDLFTMREKKGQIQDLEVAIVGDIYHSRVARSNIWGLTKLGAKVRVCGPQTLMPPDIEKLGVKAYTDLDRALDGADVVNVLRLQKERQGKGLFPSAREYAMLFGVTPARLRAAKKDVLLMHPGPMNRGVEISSDAADSGNSAILEQVTNGVAVRMAILYLLLGGADA